MNDYQTTNYESNLNITLDTNRSQSNHTYSTNLQNTLETFPDPTYSSNIDQAHDQDIQS
jgi:hypothetical protein